VPDYTWLEASLRRIRDPFLATADDKVRLLVESALDMIESNPYSPGMPCYQYKRANVPNAYVAINGSRVWIVYRVFRDYPVLALVAILDVLPAPE
jgi:hypothetical protein